MSDDRLTRYIASLPTGDPPATMAEEGEPRVNTIDVDALPKGIVTGSNLIQFPEGASAELKSSVALSLLAAQRVAANDKVVQTPDQWLNLHNTVLQNLNWRTEGGGTVKSTFDSVDVAVHKAIIPFLTAAFGGAVGAGALILTALNQLKEVDKDAPWITLFDRESRRFEVSEYQFSVVQVVGDTVHLRMAAARLDASYGRTQVLFFKINKQHATFEQANLSFSTEAALLADMNAALKVKLKRLTKSYIQSLPDDLV
ncbi:MAG: hypothetical protein AAGG50_05605 [Bacteroidota bacterium]